MTENMDELITYEEKHGVLAGRESHRNLGKGNLVRGRIIAVSFPRGGSGGKIGITLRQPFLGRIEWIQEDLKVKPSKAEKAETKPARAEKRSEERRVGRE